MPRTFAPAASWLRNLLRPGAAERRMRAELDGLGLGDNPQLDEQLREARFGAGVAGGLRELRLAGRQLRRRPAFALTAVLVLGLGIGVGTAMFSVLHAILLRPLPYAQPGRLVKVMEPRGPEEAFWSASAPDVRDWRAQGRTLAAIAYWQPDAQTLRTGDATVQLNSPDVSANLFATLGVAPRLGRVFTPADIAARAHEVVLSDAAWRKWFRARPDILGQAARLGGADFRIVGVMPPGFQYPFSNSGDIWLPYLPTGKESRDDQNLNVIARLAPGVTPRAAQTEVGGIQARIAREFPSQHVTDTVVVRGLEEALVGNLRPALWASSLAVGLIWLIACASVAGLMLTRFAAQRRELAVRAALGAGRWRLARQLLSEGLWIGAGAGAGAGAAGYGLARIMTGVLARFLAGHVPFPTDYSLSPAVLAAMAAATLVSVGLVSLAPAWSAARLGPEDGLNDRSAAAGPAQRRLRDSLVVVEIALALVLLAGAGLFLRTLQALRRVPLGFTVADVTTTRLIIPSDEFAKRSIDQVFEQPLLERLHAVPGVEAAAFSSVVPLARGVQVKGMFGIVGRPNLRPDQQPQGDMRFTSPEYPKVFGIAMERGRFFDARLDTLTSEPVIVLNHSLAARYFPGQDAVGQYISLGKVGKARIIGVLADVRQSAVAQPPAPEMHFSTTQLAPGSPFYNIGAQFAQLAVRFRDTAPGHDAAIRRALHQVAPEIAPGAFLTMRELVANSIGDQTFFARLLGLFGLGALAIALAGLYGLLAYSVAQRTRELGVRVALGAQRRQIVGLVLGRAAGLVGAGTGIGLALALLLSKLLSAYLYGVSARDPLTLGAAALLLAGTGLWAAYLPARRAARVSPITALRAE